MLLSLSFWGIRRLELVVFLLFLGLPEDVRLGSSLGAMCSVLYVNSTQTGEQSCGVSSHANGSSSYL